jgi:hypothetical protein
MIFMRVFVATAMAASLMLVVIVAPMLMIIGAPLMGVAAAVLMIMAVLVRLGLVLRMTVAAFVTTRIFMLVFVIVPMAALVFVFILFRHIFPFRLLKKAHLRLRSFGFRVSSFEFPSRHPKPSLFPQPFLPLFRPIACCLLPIAYSITSPSPFLP